MHDHSPEQSISHPLMTIQDEILGKVDGSTESEPLPEDKIPSFVLPVRQRSSVGSFGEKKSASPSLPINIAGKRAAKTMSASPDEPNQRHSVSIETYLDLGALERERRRLGLTGKDKILSDGK